MSKYILGKSRNQLEVFCLEQFIEKDNEVRLIDLFVDSLPIEEYGFDEEKGKQNNLGGRRLSSELFAQTLHLWLYEQDSLLKATRKRM